MGRGGKVGGGGYRQPGAGVTGGALLEVKSQRYSASRSTLRAHMRRKGSLMQSGGASRGNAGG